MSEAKGQTQRRYVDVIARWRDDGRIEPLSVCWPDGRSFQVDAVIGKPAGDTFPDAAVHTLRYTVRIGGRTTHLYLERTAATAHTAEPQLRWFVETRPEQPLWLFGSARSPQFPS